MYLSMHLSLCLSVCLSIYLSIYLSISIPTCLSISLSICPSLFPCLSLSLSPSLYLSVSLPLSIFFFLSFFLSFLLSFISSCKSHYNCVDHGGNQQDRCSHCTVTFCCCDYVLLDDVFVVMYCCCDYLLLWFCKNVIMYCCDYGLLLFCIVVLDDIFRITEFWPLNFLWWIIYAIQTIYVYMFTYPWSGLVGISGSIVGSGPPNCSSVFLFVRINLSWSVHLF